MYGARSSPPQSTPELARVANLPRRQWSAEERAQIVAGMTAMLRQPSGQMVLWERQAIALFEMSQVMGAYCPIFVSGGKTLISLLAFTVLGSLRPLLLVPAKLVEKTKRDWRRAAYHWKILPNIMVRSYELIGAPSGADFLEKYNPDAIVADEGHKISAPTAIRTKRITKHFKAHPECRYVDLSGSPTKRSIVDYAHRVHWAIPGPGCPLPHSYSDLQQWSGVLDEKPGAWRDEDREGGPIDPGALALLCKPGEGVREAFRRRMTDTLGVVATTEEPSTIPIVGEIFKPELSPMLRQAIAKMRKDWETPDGVGFVEAVALWRHVRELGLGFCYAWDPPAPPEWKAARKSWSAWVREIGSRYGGHHKLDHEFQIVQLVDRGHDGFLQAAQKPLAAWRAIRDTYKYRTIAQWVSMEVVEAAARMVHEGPPALVWVEHSAFGAELAKLAGLEYYAAGGLSAKGGNIMDHPETISAVASIKAVGEGFNLERFARNVMCSVITNGRQWEQTLGRTDRDGQKADEISLQILVTVPEHENALSQAQADAAYIEQTTGQPQKLLGVDWV